MSASAIPDPVPTLPTRADRYLSFSRDEWSELRAATPMTLREHDLDRLRGINERIDLDEVAAVYLPLSRLLNLYVAATQDLHKVSATFLGAMAPKVPYVIGVAGSVAVGKSTFARILQALLARWPDHPKVDLVTTDGFLYPNKVLEDRDLINRKGFPESYDARRLLAFLREVKSGAECVHARRVQPRRVRHHPRRVRRHRATRHLDPGGTQRVAGRRRRRRARRTRRVRQRLLRLLDLHRRRRGGHRGVVRRSVPRAAQRRVPEPGELLPPLRRPQRRGRSDHRQGHLDRHQRAQPARQHRAGA
ncbi:MAG: hypothetical protein WKF58_09700 [Ilumatobacteraceae bacterium]